MPELRLERALRAVAEVREGGSDAWHGCCDELARTLIHEAVPPGACVPVPDQPRARLATGSPELQAPPHDTARQCYERLYRDLCEGR